VGSPHLSLSMQSGTGFVTPRLPGRSRAERTMESVEPALDFAVQKPSHQGDFEKPP
jgi:hypothetical protein